MTEHEFVLKLEANADVEPQVRMWIDDQQTDDLSSEREIALRREVSGGWTAAFSAPGPFMYRIGIVGAPGSRWALAFRTVGAEPQELLYDSDELTMSKEWLVGTCEPAVPLRTSREWPRVAASLA
jgi:hypothetical protein